MSRAQSVSSQLKDLAVVPISGNKKDAIRGGPPAFDGTMVSVCESVCISLEKMIEMMRWARENDLRVAQFLDGWDDLDPSKRQGSRTVEMLRQRAGLNLVELLGIIAEVG